MPVSSLVNQPVFFRIAHARAEGGGVVHETSRYPGPRESVHIKLLVSPVSFSHNNVRLLMVYSPYGKFAYRETCRFRD